MPSSSASELLVKWIHHDKKIVTFRLLSRHLSIHVNTAKNELAAFYEEYLGSEDAIHATYLVSGYTSDFIRKTGIDAEDNSQPAASGTSSSSDEVTSHLQILVHDKDLESSKSRFTRVTSIHIYSLSPSKLTTPSLLTTTLDEVRKADALGGVQLAKAIGATINLNGDPSGKGKGRAVPVTIKPSTSKLLKVESKEEKVESKPKTEERKKSGTLDWGKAKPKGEPKPAVPEKKPATPAPTKPQQDVKPSPKPSRQPSIDRKQPSLTPAVKNTPAAKPSAPASSRPANKRTLVTDSEVEDEPSVPAKRQKSDQTLVLKAAHVAKASSKKRVLVSDDEADEDEDEPVVKAKVKRQKSSHVLDSDDDSDSPVVSSRRVRKGLAGRPTPKSLAKTARVMLDSDEDKDDEDEDEVLEPILEYSPSIRSTSDAESEPEHVPLTARESRNLPGASKSKGKVKKTGEEALGIDARAREEKKQKAKEIKKSAPKGKRKVEKSRTYTNAKGMMVTEDYFSFESMSEAEPNVEGDMAGDSDEPAASAPVDADAETSIPAADAKPKAKATPKPKPKPKRKVVAKVSQDTDAEEEKPTKKKVTTARPKSKQAKNVTNGSEDEAEESKSKSKVKVDEVDAKPKSTPKPNPKPKPKTVSTPKPPKPKAENDGEKDEDEVKAKPKPKAKVNTETDTDTKPKGKESDSAVDPPKKKPAEKADTKAKKPSVKAGQQTLMGFFKK